MLPIVVPKRAEVKGGLWTPRALGEFEEGDADTEFYISGSAEIKELQGHMKLFFRNVKIMHRKAPEEEEEEEKVATDIPENEEEKEKDGEEKKKDDNHVDYDDSDDDDDKKKEKVASEKKKVDEVILDNPDIVCLHLFFSKKNPKTRMVDVHKRGTKVYLNRYNPDGHFGKKGTLNDFEVSLKSIPDVLLFRGLVALKLPGDRPVTEDPVVYGFIKIQSARSLTFNTAGEMNFTEIQDIISKATDGQGKSKGGGGEEEGEGGGAKKKNSDRVKPLSVYRKNVKKAWLHFNLHDGDEVGLKQLMRVLQFLNIFLLDIQAKRVLEAVDIEGDRELGMSEVVNFLMAYDLLGPTANIDCLDIFDSLKVKPQTARGGGKRFAGGLDFSGFCEAVHMLGVRADDEDLMKVFCASSEVPEKDAASAFIDLAAFKKGWIKLAHVSDEMRARGMDSEGGLLGAGRNRDRLFR
jgi:hypothetical protein